MKPEHAAEASRLRLEYQRLLSGDFILSNAHWSRLCWITLRLQKIDPTWPKPVKGGEK